MVVVLTEHTRVAFWCCVVPGEMDGAGSCAGLVSMGCSVGLSVFLNKYFSKIHIKKG